ncbi:MAG TPA: dihydropteroate synthase [Verrucomicrobiae bacterium]|nr:dihydropteroate synthase [Verrucomicrobiae bacterium]
MLLRARQFEFRFPRPALIMGVVNVTPDSFSDGGKFRDPGKAVDHALELAAQGAEILDIGGESTRPGATPVSEAEELGRVLPVIEQLVERVKVPLSIDTMKPAVARAALEAGASIVNDVAANRAPDGMWGTVAEFNAGYVIMHMQGTPQTMQLNPTYTDVTREVGEFFEDRLERLKRAGVASNQVVLDVGLGFGKSLEHNLQLLAELESFTKLKRPLVLGASRKSFIGRLHSVQTAERLPGSLACACLAVEAGVQIIRTHDVAETVQAVRVTEAILAQRKF